MGRLYRSSRGMLKSPAMQEALKPLHRLEVEAVKNNEIAREAYAAGMSEFKLRQSVNIALKKEQLKKAGGQMIDYKFRLWRRAKRAEGGSLPHE